MQEFEPVLTPSQVETVAGLADTIWHDCYRVILTPDHIDYMLQTFQSIPAIQDQLQNQGFSYYLIKEDRTILGYLGVQPREERLFLSKIYLLDSARGKGRSGTIFSFAEEIARKEGCTVMELTVNKGNEQAIAAYKKNGFAVVREQVTDVGSGYVMDDYVLEKPLGG